MPEPNRSETTSGRGRGRPGDLGAARRRGKPDRLQVEVQNRQRQLCVDTGWLRRHLTEVASREGLEDQRLSVVLVSERRMRQLNRDFHGRDQTTDVLAFDYGPPGGPDDVNGEVIVSAQMAQAEARRRGLPAERELLLYCVHGLLHLAGYDDGTAAGRRRMWERQLTYLAEAGFPGGQRKQAAPDRDVDDGAGTER